MMIGIVNMFNNRSLRYCRFLGTCCKSIPRIADVRCFSYSSIMCSDAKYDVVVIGGGSGGLACAKEVGDLGGKAAVFDFVDPTPQGTTWGLGGTCVNVGCIPKKLMHHAAILGHSIQDAKKYGWNLNGTVTHDWGVLSENVQSYVRSLNWGHRVQLKEKKIDYFNANASFVTPNLIQGVQKNGKLVSVEADNVVVAVGGRPRYLDIPGCKENCITSDDLFWMQKSPGKTLVIGASYVALECAGFLTGLGYDASVMVRSICLRGFDQQMAELVKENMKEHGTKFLETTIPTRMERTESGQCRVFWKNLTSQQESSDIFDTVLVATGRIPVTSSLNLRQIGVETKNGYILSPNATEQSTVSNVFGIGDVLHNRPELTPVAAMAGRLLARRLITNSSNFMDYDKVPTTVFTPLEYGSVGLSEEAAIEMHGEDALEVFHAFYKPLEYTVAERNSAQCYMKVICERGEDQRVLGFHILGPNAGEMTQGFAVAVRAGLSYKTLSQSVGIHPTCAEEIVKLHITKRSGLDPTVTGC